MDVVNKKTGTVVGGAAPRAVVQYLGLEKDVDRDDAPWIVVEELTHPQEYGQKSSAQKKIESAPEKE